MTITCTPQELSELLGGKPLCIQVASKAAPEDAPGTAAPPQPGPTVPTWWGPGPYDPIRPTLTCGAVGNKDPIVSHDFILYTTTTFEGKD